MYPRTLPAAVAFAAVALVTASGAHAQACRALDGDTLQCGAERVRLYDVYAAEWDEPGGREARRNLQRRLAEGGVRLVRHGQDRYGRTLADAYVNGRKILQSDIGPRAGRGLRSGYASRVVTRRPPPQPAQRAK
jgi:endonuclease YncB( thermonuclease family)